MKGCSNCGTENEDNNADAILTDEVSETAVSAEELTIELSTGEPLKTTVEVKKRPSVVKIAGASGAFLLLIAIASLVYLHFFHSDTAVAKAKVVVNEYLTAIKNGNSVNGLKSSDLNNSVKIADYKFLDVKERSKGPAELLFNKDMYNKVYEDKNGSFEEWKEHMKHKLPNWTVIHEDSFEIRFQSKTEMQNKLVLLYDVSFTVSGQKLDKELSFTVVYDDSKDDFKMSSVDY